MQQCASSSHMNMSTLVLPTLIQKNKGDLPTAVLGVMTSAGQWLTSGGQSSFHQRSLWFARLELLSSQLTLEI